MSRRDNAIIVTRLAKLLRVVQNGASAKQIHATTGLCKTTISTYLRTLHREGLIHCIGFGRDSRGHPRPNMRIWKMGPGEDAIWDLPDRNTRRRMKRLASGAKPRPTTVAPPKGPTKEALRAVQRVSKSCDLAAVMLNLGR